MQFSQYKAISCTAEHIFFLKPYFFYITSLIAVGFFKQPKCVQAEQYAQLKSSWNIYYNKKLLPKTPCFLHDQNFNNFIPLHFFLASHH